jgi:hypothetical protein
MAELNIVRDPLGQTKWPFYHNVTSTVCCSAVGLFLALKGATPAGRRGSYWGYRRHDSNDAARPGMTHSGHLCLPKPAAKSDRPEHADELRGDEGHNACRGDPGKSVGQRACDCYGRICKRC